MNAKYPLFLALVLFTLGTILMMVMGANQPSAWFFGIGGVCLIYSFMVKDEN